ncbi:MAG: GNAT family N-acetyltransferase [Pseudomonadales bacterium]|jgi:GNAT superfamily N-acetyltransferase|nr:GNAT family N-acetyltransferase [Pseudomonadales bacterium]
MGSMLTIRDAAAADLVTLASLALRSKGHWGYASEHLAVMRAELSWDEDDLGRMCFRVGETRGGLVGFAAVEPLGEGCGELEALFVAPEHIGTGAGRALMDDAKAQAIRLGCRVLVIQSDPHAEGFYLAAGARRVGERPSMSIPGRALPLLELGLAP